MDDGGFKPCYDCNGLGCERCGNTGYVPEVESEFNSRYTESLERARQEYEAKGRPVMD